MAFDLSVPHEFKIITETYVMKENMYYPANIINEKIKLSGFKVVRNFLTLFLGNNASDVKM
jgi:hypothetical protein